jgi:hypothetical protein
VIVRSKGIAVMKWWNRFPGCDEAVDRDQTVRALHFDAEGWESVKARGDMLEWREALGNTLHVCFTRELPSTSPSDPILDP